MGGDSIVGLLDGPHCMLLTEFHRTLVWIGADEGDRGIEHGPSISRSVVAATVMVRV